MESQAKNLNLLPGIHRTTPQTSLPSPHFDPLSKTPSLETEKLHVGRSVHRIRSPPLSAPKHSIPKSPLRSPVPRIGSFLLRESQRTKRDASLRGTSAFSARTDEIILGLGLDDRQQKAELRRERTMKGFVSPLRRSLPRPKRVRTVVVASLVGEEVKDADEEVSGLLALMERERTKMNLIRRLQRWWRLRGLYQHFRKRALRRKRYAGTLFRGWKSYVCAVAFHRRLIQRRALHALAEAAEETMMVQAAALRLNAMSNDKGKVATNRLLIHLVLNSIERPTTDKKPESTTTPSIDDEEEAEHRRILRTLEGGVDWADPHQKIKPTTPTKKQPPSRAERRSSMVGFRPGGQLAPWGRPELLPPKKHKSSSPPKRPSSAPQLGRAHVSKTPKHKLLIRTPSLANLIHESPSPKESPLASHHMERMAELSSTVQRKQAMANKESFESVAIRGENMLKRAFFDALRDQIQKRNDQRVMALRIMLRLLDSPDQSQSSWGSRERRELFFFWAAYSRYRREVRLSIGSKRRVWPQTVQGSYAGLWNTFVRKEVDRLQRMDHAKAMGRRTLLRRAFRTLAEPIFRDIKARTKVALARAMHRGKALDRCFAAWRLQTKQRHIRRLFRPRLARAFSAIAECAAKTKRLRLAEEKARAIVAQYSQRRSLLSWRAALDDQMALVGRTTFILQRGAGGYKPKKESSNVAGENISSWELAQSSGELAERLPNSVGLVELWNRWNSEDYIEGGGRGGDGKSVAKKPPQFLGSHVHPREQTSKALQSSGTLEPGRIVLQAMAAVHRLRGETDAADRIRAWLGFSSQFKRRRNWRWLLFLATRHDAMQVKRSVFDRIRSFSRKKDEQTQGVSRAEPGELEVFWNRAREASVANVLDEDARRELADELIDGAPDQIDGTLRRTALHVAAEELDVDEVKRLLLGMPRNPLEVMSVTVRHQRALLASGVLQDQDEQCADLGIPANPNARDERGDTPLHIAARRATGLAVPVCLALLEAGARIGVRNLSGYTAAQVAANAHVRSVLVETAARIEAHEFTRRELRLFREESIGRNLEVFEFKPMWRFVAHRLALSRRLQALRTAEDSSAAIEKALGPELVRVPTFSVVGSEALLLSPSKTVARVRGDVGLAMQIQQRAETVRRQELSADAVYRRLRRIQAARVLIASLNLVSGKELLARSNAVVGERWKMTLAGVFRSRLQVDNAEVRTSHTSFHMLARTPSLLTSPMRSSFSAKTPFSPTASRTPNASFLNNTNNDWGIVAEAVEETDETDDAVPSDRHRDASLRAAMLVRAEEMRRQGRDPDTALGHGWLERLMQQDENDPSNANQQLSIKKPPAPTKRQPSLDLKKMLSSNINSGANDAEEWARRKAEQKRREEEAARRAREREEALARGEEVPEFEEEDEADNGASGDAGSESSNDSEEERKQRRRDAKLRKLEEEEKERQRRKEALRARGVLLAGTGLARDPFSAGVAYMSMVDRIKQAGTAAGDEYARKQIDLMLTRKRQAAGILEEGEADPFGKVRENVLKKRGISLAQFYEDARRAYEDRSLSRWNVVRVNLGIGVSDALKTGTTVGQRSGGMASIALAMARKSKSVDDKRAAEADVEAKRARASAAMDLLAKTAIRMEATAEAEIRLAGSVQSSPRPGEEMNEDDEYLGGDEDEFLAARRARKLREEELTREEERRRREAEDLEFGRGSQDAADPDRVWRELCAGLKQERVEMRREQQLEEVQLKEIQTVGPTTLGHRRIWRPIEATLVRASAGDDVKSRVDSGMIPKVWDAGNETVDDEFSDEEEDEFAMLQLRPDVAAAAASLLRASSHHGDADFSNPTPSTSKKPPLVPKAPILGGWGGRRFRQEEELDQVLEAAEKARWSSQTQPRVLVDGSDHRPSDEAVQLATEFKRRAKILLLPRGRFHSNASTSHLQPIRGAIKSIVDHHQNEETPSLATALTPRAALEYIDDESDSGDEVAPSTWTGSMIPCNIRYDPDDGLQELFHAVREKRMHLIEKTKEALAVLEREVQVVKLRQEALESDVVSLAARSKEARQEAEIAVEQLASAKAEVARLQALVRSAPNTSTTEQAELERLRSEAQLQVQLCSSQAEHAAIRLDRVRRILSDSQASDITMTKERIQADKAVQVANSRLYHLQTFLQTSIQGFQIERSERIARIVARLQSTKTSHSPPASVTSEDAALGLEF